LDINAYRITGGVMTVNRSDSAAQQTRDIVVELIQDEHYVIISGGSGAIPDEDVIGELRILAYVRRGKGTLGPESAQAVETLAEAVATGVITNTIWAGCQSAKRFAVKLRAQHRERIRKAEEAEQRALEAVRAVPIPVTASPAAEVTVSGSGADGTTWKLSCKFDGRPVEVHMDGAGMAIDVIIGARS
jgi:hypothetical protein